MAHARLYEKIYLNNSSELVIITALEIARQREILSQRMPFKTAGTSKFIVMGVFSLTPTNP